MFGQIVPSIAPLFGPLGDQGPKGHVHQIWSELAQIFLDVENMNFPYTTLYGLCELWAQNAVFVSQRIT